jgi:hypothetical protein
MGPKLERRRRRAQHLLAVAKIRYFSGDAPGAVKSATASLSIAVDARTNDGQLTTPLFPILSDEEFGVALAAGAGRRTRKSPGALHEGPNR